MSTEPDITRDLQQLATDLRQLEAEYNAFFAGRLPRPPLETRGRVEAVMKRWDRRRIETSVDRFRFQTIQSRFATFVELWDRGQRAREEGRPGPFAQPPAKETAKRKEQPPESRILHVTAFSDPMREMDKLQALYETLMDARRELGDDAVPFHKFAALVKNQVAQFRESGSPEVAFRVAVKDGKVNFTARGLKGGSE
ncbi:MAG: MXAN_5187 C-terminal domain-containing protein [Vicinamibacterales bacterium]